MTSTLAQQIVNMLIKQGITNVKAWSSRSYFGIERIYYSNCPGYIELSGKYGFRVEGNVIPQSIIDACKKCLYDWNKKFITSNREEDYSPF